MMEHRTLGQPGLRVLSIGLGRNDFGGRLGIGGFRRVMHKVLGLGIIRFDTAEMYDERGGSETGLGHILKSERKLSFSPQNSAWR